MLYTPSFPPSFHQLCPSPSLHPSLPLLPTISLLYVAITVWLGCAYACAGTSHLLATCIILFQIRRSLSQRYEHYLLLGGGVHVQRTAAAATFLLILIPLFELNASLGKASGSGRFLPPFLLAGEP